MFFQRLLHRWRSDRRAHDFTLWYDPAYRLPIISLEAQTGIEPRRSDFVLWYLLDVNAIRRPWIRRPRKVRYTELARVHDCEYLESLSHAETLATIFAVDAWDIPTDQLLRALRLACGATLEAARTCLHHGGIALNLQGGFHHASPKRGGGMCPVNDVAVAIATLRSEGFDGQVVVLDLDAHPPDGTADCLVDDPKAWIGSISGCDWGHVDADETVLPAGTGDDLYLKTLRGLLKRMPRPDIAFVLAGGDVLAVDKMGGLALTLEGAQQRDKMVYDALETIPSVWLPAGGYSTQAWQLLASTGLLLSTGKSSKIKAHYNPLRARYHKIAQQLRDEDLEGEEFITNEDLAEALLGLSPGQQSSRMLGYYTASGIEYALFRYGILDYLRRLGYDNFHVKLDANSTGDRMRLLGKHKEDAEEHLLIEGALEKQEILGKPMLYIHWLNLRHPRAKFSDKRPRLPGQDVPGLGLARESGELLRRIAQRLKLEGVAFQPAWYHVAYTMRRRFQFADPVRQGRFEAMVRDLSAHPLLQLTLAVAAEQIQLNDQRYTWESDVMVAMPERTPEQEAQIEAEREACRFTVIALPESCDQPAPAPPPAFREPTT